MEGEGAENPEGGVGVGGGRLIVERERKGEEREGEKREVE